MLSGNLYKAADISHKRRSIHLITNRMLSDNLYKAADISHNCIHTPSFVI